MKTSEGEIFEFSGLFMKKETLKKSYLDIVDFYYKSAMPGKRPLQNIESIKRTIDDNFLKIKGIEKLCLYRGWVEESKKDPNLLPVWNSLLKKNMIEKHEKKKFGVGYNFYKAINTQQNYDAIPTKTEQSEDDKKEEELFNKTAKYWDYLIANNRPEADRILEEANIKAAMISRSPMKKIVDSASDKGSLSSQKIIMSFVQIILQADKTHLAAIKSGDFRVTDFDELKKQEAKNATIF